MKKFICRTFFFLFFASTQAQEKTMNLLIGTYTKTCDSKGIYVYNFNLETAETKLKANTENIVNPSYLTLSSDKKFVYSVNEDGGKSKVSAFSFESSSGSLKLLNQISSEGADPCYIINDDKNVVIANYSGGSVVVFGKNEDGSLTTSKQVFTHNGKGINKIRQESAHVHMVQFSPDKKYLLVNDLGVDFIIIYKYNPEQKKKVLETVKAIKIKPGSGPRHLTFSADGKFAYLVQELDGTVTVFKYNDGNLKQIQETTVIANDFKGETSAADIHITPDGKFLYATNRGDANTISCFDIKNNGKLKFKQNYSTFGKGPRNFAIDPAGNFLLVAHQYSNDVVIFKIDKTTGALIDSGKRIELCSPVCLVFE